MRSAQIVWAWSRKPMIATMSRTSSRQRPTTEKLLRDRRSNPRPEQIKGGDSTTTTPKSPLARLTPTVRVASPKNRALALTSIPNQGVKSTSSLTSSPDPLGFTVAWNGPLGAPHQLSSALNATELVLFIPWPFPEILLKRTSLGAVSTRTPVALLVPESVLPSTRLFFAGPPVPLAMLENHIPTVS